MSGNFRRNHYTIILLVLFLVILGGCSEDDPVEPIVDEDDPGGFITVDLMMDGFKQIYEGMLIEECEGMLHPDFRLVLLESTIADWENSTTPINQHYFDKDMGIQIHRKIFEGLGGMDEDGNPVDPISAIKVIVLDKIRTWTAVNESDENFGNQDAFWNRYHVFIHFEQPNSKRFEVDQQVDFYAKQIDGYWYLLGMRGYISKAKLDTQSTSIDAVLSLYR